jgi:hypothetical protein
MLEKDVNTHHTNKISHMIIWFSETALLTNLVYRAVVQFLPCKHDCGFEFVLSVGFGLKYNII